MLIKDIQYRNTKKFSISIIFLRLLQIYVFALPLYSISFFNLQGMGILRPDWIAASFIAGGFVAIELFWNKRYKFIIPIPLIFLIFSILLNLFNFFKNPDYRILDYSTSSFQAFLAILISIIIINIRIKWKHLIRLVKSWLVLATVHSIYAIYQALARILDWKYAWPEISNPSYEGQVVRAREVIPGFFTPSGIFPEPAFLARYLLPPLVILMIFIIYGKERHLSKKRWHCLFATFLISTALLLTTRLTAFLPLFFISIVIWVDKGNRFALQRRFNVPLRIIIVLIIIFLVLIFSSLVFQLITGSNLLLLVARRLTQFVIEFFNIGEQGYSVLRSYHESISFSTRMTRSIESFSVWIQNPIFGVGLKGLGYYRGGSNKVHNAFAQVLVEQGLVGLLAFLGIWVDLLIKIRNKFRAHRNDIRGIYFISLFYMLITTMSLLFLGKTWFELLAWFNIALGYSFLYKGKEVTSN